jgi:hypothetical protein
MVAPEKRKEKKGCRGAGAGARKRRHPVISVPVISSDDGHVLSVVSENSEPACLLLCAVPVRLFALV